MKRSWLLLLFLLLGAGALRADQTTSTVQQALKDQGFYYGSVTGKKDADTTAAIRRYQIRNGLQITGEMDAETLRSLGVGSNATTGATPAPTPPPATPAPAATPAEEDEEAGQSAEIPDQAPAPETRQGPPGQQYYAPGPRGLRPETSGVFDGTPYEIAPPNVQRHVIVGAQALLARAGFYRSGIDGEFGPGTAAAVRAFQAREGLPPNGRLNMETLAALGLLPGQHGPALRPHGARPLRRPVYRGQWVPE